MGHCCRKGGRHEDRGWVDVDGRGWGEWRGHTFRANDALKDKVESNGLYLVSDVRKSHSIEAKTKGSRGERLLLYQYTVLHAARLARIQMQQ